MSTDKDFAEIKSILNTPLSDNPEELNNQLRYMSSWQGRLCVLETDANYDLRLAKAASLHKLIGQDIVANDKKIMIEAETANEERLSDLMHLWRIVLADKIMAAMSLRKGNFVEQPNTQEG